MKSFIQIVIIAALATPIFSQSLHGDNCVENADCFEAENLQCVEGQCACVPGFSENRRRTCWRSFGEACEWILDCNVDTFLKCNDTTYTCDCQQPGMWFKIKFHFCCH